MDRNLIMGTAGHVDHGKTALIRALTGIDCDTHKEEKDRGITINLGFSHLELPSGNSIGIVDVPGHKDFIRTMVAGAYGIDFVLLVIAADSGIMPQTKEHLNILQILGIKKGIIAITKADLVDEETMELARLEVMELLEDTPLEDAPVVPVSSVSMDGIDELVKEIEKFSDDVPDKSGQDVFRMYVDRIFNVKGQGLVVTGSVLNGSIKVGKEIFLLPGNHDKLRIRGIQRHGQAVDQAAAGERIAFNLAGLKVNDFDRGMLLSDQKLEETSMIDAHLQLFEGSQPLEIWSQALFHTGTFYCKARVHLLNKDTLNGTEDAAVQIHLDKPAILLPKDKFIIRNSSNEMTLGGGTIIDNNPLHHKRRTDKLIQEMDAVIEAMLNENSMIGSIKLELRKATGPVNLTLLAEKLMVSSENINMELATETASGILSYEISGNKYLITEYTENKLIHQIIEHIGVYHCANPLTPSGLTTKDLAGKLRLTSADDQKFLEALMEKTKQQEKIITNNNTWSLPDHEVKIDNKLRQKIDLVEGIILGNGLQKPEIQKLEQSVAEDKINRGQLKMILTYLAGQRRIFMIGEDCLHTTIVDRCRKQLLNDLSSKPEGINEKEFRLLIDGTKKIVQFLLTIFTHEGVIDKKTFFIHITEKGRSLI